MNILIETFNREQLEFILVNHTLFTKNEVTIAAKRMVVKGKEAKLRANNALNISRLQGENYQAQYNATMRGLFHQDQDFHRSSLLNALSFRL